MRKLIPAVALCLALAACGDRQANSADQAATPAAEGGNESSTRAEIVVDNNVRFRVDPDGTRVRIDGEGAGISVGNNVKADVRLGREPALEVSTNRH